MNTALRPINPSAAMVFFKTYVAIGGEGVNDPPGVSRLLCHLEIKFQRLYLFSRVRFSTVNMLTLSGDSFTPKFKMAHENRK